LFHYAGKNRAWVDDENTYVSNDTFSGMFPSRVGKFMKLPHRLLIIVILALVPLSALQIYSAFRLENQQILATFTEAQRFLQLIEDEQASTIAGIRRLLTTVRQVPAILDQDWARCQEMMN
jgi:hypothetical protein